ncbi:MAG: Gfo/Idh/MocA family protein [Akkermansiaceae bacterium]
MQIGFIGNGKRTGPVLRTALKEAGVQVTAMCEIEGTRLEAGTKTVNDSYGADKKSGNFKGCASYVDYREMLEKENLDAVVIMTPDHMHVHPSLAAIAKGCDVYCEKPLTQNIAEGRILAEAVKKAGTVFQTGSQQRSEYGGRFRKAVELVWAGRIGEVKKIHVGVGSSPIPCDLPSQELPENIDWDLWIGPAPMRGFNEALCPKGMHNHYPAFRKYEEYAGGGLADMGAHHFDIAQWGLGMDDSGPVSVEPPKEGEKGLKFTYENGVEMFHGGFSGTTFEGTEGTIQVGRGSLKVSPEKLLEIELPKDAKRVTSSTNHFTNWIECIQARKDPICTAEIGHRTATVCHLANIGYKLRRKLNWDPKKEEFVGDEEANGLRGRKPREGWEY